MNYPCQQQYQSRFLVLHSPKQHKFEQESVTHQSSSKINLECQSSRFIVRSDPLQNFRQSRQKIQKIYPIISHPSSEHLSEQKFIAIPNQQVEETLVIQENNQSLLECNVSQQPSKQGIVEEKEKSQNLSNTRQKHKIFNNNQPQFYLYIQQKRTAKQQRTVSMISEQVQTSFISGIQHKDDLEDSKSEKSLQVLFQQNEQQIGQLENNYDFTKWQSHDNWKPNLSETRFRLTQEDYHYFCCQKCDNILKEDNLPQHELNYCNQHKPSRQKELLRKFHYLLKYETNRLRDYNVKCQQTRMYCLITLEILQILINTDKNDEKCDKLKNEIIKINSYVQRLSHNYTIQICELCNYLIKKL